MGQGARQAHPMPAAGTVPLDHPMHALTLRAPSPSSGKALHEDQIAGAIIAAEHTSRLRAGLFEVFTMLAENDWL